jgi:cobaltochelatase CobT
MPTLKESDLERLGRILSDHYGIRLICRGDRAFTDGNTIYLPSLPQVIDDEEIIAPLRMFLDHEVGHIIGKSEMAVLAEVKAKYGKVGMNIVQTLEDRRCEALMTEAFAGSGLNFRDGMKHLMAKMKADAGTEGHYLTHAAKQFGVSIYCLNRYGGIPDWVKPEIAELAKRNANLIRQAEGMPSTRSLLPIVDALFRDYEKTIKPEPEQTPDQQPVLQGGTYDPDAPPVPDDGDEATTTVPAAPPDQPSPPPPPSPDVAQPDHAGSPPQSDESPSEGAGGGGTGAGDSSPPTPDDDCPGPEEGIGEEAAKALKDALREDTRKANALGGDAAVERYRPFNGDEQDTWVKISPYVTDTESCQRRLKGFNKVVRLAGGAAQQRLSQLLMSEDRVGFRRGMRRGQPDPASLYKLAQGLSDRVMRRPYEVTAPDTACLLLVDMSSSMHGSKISNAVRAAAVFARVLDACHHKSYVVGFSGGGGAMNAPTGMRINRVHMKVAKDWNESYREAERKLVTMEMSSGGGTPMAEAMQLAYRQQLSKRPEKRKVMMVFGDGDPTSTGPFANGKDFAAKVCQYLHNRGVEPVLIGIETNVMKRIYKQSAYCPNVQSLPSMTMRELTKVLYRPLR